MLTEKTTQSAFMEIEPFLDDAMWAQLSLFP